MSNVTRYSTRLTTLIFATLSLLLITTDLTAQSPGDPEKYVDVPSAQRSNAEGTHFVIGFMKNEESTSWCELFSWRNSRQRIAIASRYATTVYITLPNGNQIIRNIEPLRVETLVLNNDSYECLSEICDNTIDVRSDEPINVYGFSSKTHTSDGYLALPTGSWGTEYVTANYYLDYYAYNSRTDPDSCSLEPRGGEFAVIASEDNTRVTIVPKVGTRNGYAPGVPVERILMRGEMWMLEDGGTLRGGSDITGSTISADKPVGVLTGHVRTGIPYAPGRFQHGTPSTKDHLIEMIAPIKDLGSRHIIVPFGGRRGGDIVRIVAAHPGGTTATVSTASGRLNYNLAGKGSFQEIHVTSVTVIETTQDVLVAHYSQSNGVDEESEFDPYMIAVTPEEQFSKSAVFQTMANETGDNRPQFNSHFVTIVAEQENFQTLRLNGRPILSLPYVGFGNVPTLESEYAWMTLRINQDAIYVLEGNAEFGGYVYGIGQWDSYGWPVGTGDTPVDVDTIPPRLTAEPECGTLYWTITATDSLSQTDSTSQDKGLVFLQLNPDESENVRVVSANPGLPANQPVPVASLRVTLIDRSLPGRATVVAVDAGGREVGVGNTNAIEVFLEVIPPTFSRDSILFTGARVNTLRQDDLFITNENGTPFHVDSVRLLRGVEFKMAGMGEFGIIDRQVDGTDDPISIGISFFATKTNVYRDTLLVWIDCIPYKIPLTALMSVPTITTEDLDFGTRRRDADSCTQIRVTNDGEETLVINNVEIDGVGGHFGYDGNNPPELPIILEPGESRLIWICFDAKKLGTHNGTVTFRSNAAAGDSVGTLIGRVIAPAIEILGHDFGAVQLGDTKCDSVPVVNVGSVPVELTGVTIMENVFVEDDSIFPVTLLPGDTLWVPVCFTPTDEPLISSLIGADNEDGLEATATLTGSGYFLLAEIDGYDWENRWVGTMHDTIVQVRNLTDRPIVVDSIWLANGDQGDFTLLTQIPPAITLAPNAEYPIDVRFSPLAVGDRSIGIYARTNSRRQPIVENLLEGFGVQPIPADELIHDTNTIFACSDQRSSILLYNRGNAPLSLDQIWIDYPNGTPDPRVGLNAPASGAQIPVGETPIPVEITYNPGGTPSEITVTVRWTFNELPGEEFSRTITFRSESQEFSLTAAAPPQIDNAERFDLYVSISDIVRPEILHNEVVLEISYNPNVSYFDKNRFSKLVGDLSGPWTFIGTPEFSDALTVRLRLVPSMGLPLPLEDMTFPGIPFRGFFGETPLDTFGIAMSVDQDACVLPKEAALPYSITHICGLSSRLFQFGFGRPVLSQSKPNPAQTSAVIDVSIPVEGDVVLEIYSADGAQVAELVNGEMEEGDHSLTVDLSRLPSGVYYYRMEYGSYVATRTLVVQK